jgi:hypothetical protein
VCRVVPSCGCVGVCGRWVRGGPPRPSRPLRRPFWLSPRWSPCWCAGCHRSSRASWWCRTPPASCSSPCAPSLALQHYNRRRQQQLQQAATRSGRPPSRP